MARDYSTLRTRFAQINFAANAQKPQTDTGLADDTGLKNPPSGQTLTTQPIPTRAISTRAIARRDVRSVSFSVIPAATSNDVYTGVSPKPKTPIAPPPALNLSIFTTQTLPTTLENLRTHVQYLLCLPLPVRVKNRLRLKYWAMSRRLEAVSELLKLDGVDKLRVDPNCFDLSEFDLSHLNLSGETIQSD